MPAGPERRAVRKVVGYVVHDRRLLVFTHDQLPLDVLGVQVPAGTVEPGEPPESAVVREVLEETGISARVLRSPGSNTTTCGPPNLSSMSGTSSSSSHSAAISQRNGAPVRITHPTRVPPSDGPADGSCWSRHTCSARDSGHAWEKSFCGIPHRWRLDDRASGRGGDLVSDSLVRAGHQRSLVFTHPADPAAAAAPASKTDRVVGDTAPVSAVTIVWKTSPGGNAGAALLRRRRRRAALRQGGGAARDRATAAVAGDPAAGAAARRPPACIAPAAVSP
ncbi:NUDIX domain-containing protein [Enemella evansiae]|uniref:NUDIX domain-containing protein n=1 Tax=Enemella evansiae TaxID=2016499 RepID=UPI0039834C0C